MTTQPTSVPHVTGRALVALRLIWVGVVSLYLLVLVYGVPLLMQQYASLTGFSLNIGFSNWSSDGLRIALDSLGLSITAYTTLRLLSEFGVTLAFIGLGILLFLRRSNDAIGWFTGLFLVTFGVVFNGAFGAMRAAYPHLSAPLSLAWGLPWLLFYVFFYIFPDGRFVPPWTRWVAVLLLIFVLFLTLLPALEILFPVFLLVAFGSAVFAQVHRYRRVATPTQRAQIRWVMFSVALIAFLELFGQGVLRLAFPQFVVEGTTKLVYDLSVTTLTFPIYAMLPLSLTIAILRYRLWDIDIIIRRTLIYGTLTAILAAIYTGTVVVLQQIMSPLLGGDGQITIVASTLALAALFRPLRRRIQTVIDRRFYRQRYNATRIMQAFSAQLREETDLHQLTADLLQVVQDTLQPAHASVWLAEQVQLTKEQGR